MTFSKTLMLAAVATLSLGAAAAHAQNLTINNGAAGYGFGQPRSASPEIDQRSELVPSGSSDTGRAKTSRDRAPILFGGDGGA